MSVLTDSAIKRAAFHCMKFVCGTINRTGGGISAFDGTHPFEQCIRKGIADVSIYVANTKSVNEKQVDGDHYKTEIQPWDFIEANNLTFIEGNIVKYVARHRSKNGVRDLRKAQHYLEKLIEIEQLRELPDA